MFFYPSGGTPYYKISTDIEDSVNPTLYFVLNQNLPSSVVSDWCGTLEFVGYQCPQTTEEGDDDPLCVCTWELECNTDGTGVPEDWAIYVWGTPPQGFDDLGYRRTQVTSDRIGIWIELGHSNFGGPWGEGGGSLNAEIFTLNTDFGSGDCVSLRDCCSQECTDTRPWTTEQYRNYWRNNVQVSIDFSGVTTCSYSTSASLSGCENRPRSVSIAASGFSMDGIVGDLVTFSYMVAFSVGADPSCEGCDPTYYSEETFPGGGWSYTGCGNLDVTSGFSPYALKINVGGTSTAPANDNPSCDNQTPDTNWCYLPPPFGIYIHGVHGRLFAIPDLDVTQIDDLFWDQTIDYTIQAEFIGDTFGLIPASGVGEPAGSIRVSITAPPFPTPC